MHKKIGGEVCGPSCNPETNDRGLKLLDFVTYNNLVLAKTLGNHKPSRRWTWHSPDGTHHNQIDYILVKKRFRLGIKIARTRTFPGADVGSDHDMTMMTFQTRLKNSKKPTQPRIRFDHEKPKDPTVMSAFQATIGGRFAPRAMLVDEDADLDSMVTHFNKAVTDTAAELLDKQRRKRKPWLPLRSFIYVTKDETWRKREASKKEPKTIERSKVKYKGILFYEILMDCVARKRMQKTTSNYLKWFPRYCDLNFYMLSH